MVSSLKVARRDAGTYHLLSPEGPAGLLRADAIRLDGFTDREAATTAAAVAAATLERWYAVRGIGVSHPGSIPETPEDFITVRGMPAGRVATADVVDADAGGYAIEVPVPPGAWLATRLQLAQQMYGAIRERGLFEAAPAGVEVSA